MAIFIKCYLVDSVLRMGGGGGGNLLGHCWLLQTLDFGNAYSSSQESTAALEFYFSPFMGGDEPTLL